MRLSAKEYPSDEALGHYGDSLENTVYTAGRSVRRAVEKAGEDISRVSEKVTDEIRHKPLQASLIALASGFVLGMLFRR